MATGFVVINTSDYAEYAPIIRETYTVLGILLTAHFVFAFCTGCSSAPFGLAGPLFNDDFLSCSIAVLITILAYNLVFKRLITIE